MRAESLVRRRGARLVFAVALLGVAGWTFLPYATHRVSVSAFVNSELLRVTAPFPGKLSQELPRKGVLIDSSTPLTLIEALSPDKRHLQDLELQYELAKQSSELAQRQLREIARFDFDLGTRIEAYRLAKLEQISREAKQSEAEYAGCQAELEQRHDVTSRFQTLTDAGLASPIRSAEAQAIQQATATRCNAVKAKLSRTQLELDSARDGVFLQDGSGDVPYSQQQRDRLVLRRQELELLALQEAARSSQLAAEIAAERDRTERLESYKIVLPAEHVVWATAASPGSAVTEGQTILDLADCNHRFVAVELPERDFEEINIGDKVAIRLVGSNEWREGRVQQVRGSAARVDDRLFAAQMPNTDPATITVEVSLPPDVMPADGADYCSIGRLAEVRFRRRFFDIAEGLATGWHAFTDSWRRPSRLTVARDQ